MASIARLPMPLMEAYEWQYEGACREADPETFFSPESERGPRRHAREHLAKTYCARCSVRDQCLQHALKVKEPYGVWGGLTTGERAALATGERSAG
jgi:WhiB family redox-sensing transcriptional regulator